MANGYLESKFESIPGNEVNTPTLSTKEIFFPVITATPDLGPTPMLRDDELVGTDEPRPALSDTYDPTWDYSSRMYPDLLAYLLKAEMGAPTTTTGNGVITDPDGIAVPTGAFRHVWTTPPTGVTPQTMQQIVSYKDQGVYFKLKGCAVEKISLTSPTQGGAMVAANGPALYMAATADPALSPTYQAAAVRPFTRTNLQVSWDAVSAVDATDFTIDFENPVETVRSLGSGSAYADIMERGDAVFTVSGTIAFRTLDKDDWEALKSAEGFTATAKWLSQSFITGAYPFKAFAAMSNCQYVGGSVDPISNTRHHGTSFNWKATNAGSAAATITVVNSTSSYA